MNKFNILCVPAKIRKCKGICVESLTSENTRKALQELLDWFYYNEDDKYYIYGLRHIENDWSTPRFICENNVFINKFGWFITRDKMGFNKTDDVMLTSKNSEFYYHTATNPTRDYEKIKYFDDRNALNVRMYLINRNEIWKYIDNN